MPVAAPLIAAGISTAGSVAASKLASSSAKGDVAGAFQGMQGAYGNAQTLQRTGQQAMGTGLPMFQQGAGYFQNLLGNRQQAQAATAPAAANITDAFSGAQRGVERSFLRGGERDMAVADLSRDKTNQVSRLYAGVQPQAASALAGAGSQMYGQGIGATQAATQAYGTGGQLGLGAGQYVGNQSAAAGAGFGNLLFNIMRTVNFGRKPQTGGYGGIGTQGYPGDSVSPVNNPLGG